MSVRTAVIPAAGLGTRFLPATKAVPKEMLPIVDKPVIEYIVDEAVASGIDRIVIITSQSKRAIEDHFDNFPELERRLEAAGRIDDLARIRRLTEMAHFIFVRQGEPKGNGHAVLCARAAVGNEPFAMIWGDDIVDPDYPGVQDLTAVYDQHGGAVAGVMNVRADEVSKYGIIDAEPLADRTYRLRRIVEKPEPAQAPSTLATVHAWVLPPRIFEILEHTPPGKDGEIWLVDAIATLLTEEPVYAAEFRGKRYDAGDRLQFLQATVDFALRRPELREPLRRHLEEALAATHVAS
jgi:UTP--glucose-1-phosphate uridylyltransferase